MVLAVILVRQLKKNLQTTILKSPSNVQLIQYFTSIVLLALLHAHNYKSCQYIYEYKQELINDASKW